MHFNHVPFVTPPRPATFRLIPPAHVRYECLPLSHVDGDFRAAQIRHVRLVRPADAETLAFLGSAEEPTLERQIPVILSGDYKLFRLTERWIDMTGWRDRSSRHVGTSAVLTVAVGGLRLIASAPRRAREEKGKAQACSAQSRPTLSGRAVRDTGSAARLATMTKSERNPGPTARAPKRLLPVRQRSTQLQSKAHQQKRPAEGPCHLGSPVNRLGHRTTVRDTLVSRREESN